MGDLATEILLAIACGALERTKKRGETEEEGVREGLQTVSRAQVGRL